MQQNVVNVASRDNDSVKIYTSKDHHIRHNLIDPHAMTVLQQLHEAGYTAYLVGGSVRDLLLNQKPKDFDISTSAKPEEIKALFKRSCILIGRRFRLAHIRFNNQIIEVATFRSGDPSEEGLIVQDNIWGSPEEDVMRRDFTINGLFYDPSDHKIIDYVGGFEDLHAHYLRTIGDPALRFQQDPVRMLRMQKFRARFGFNVDPMALEMLNIYRYEIKKSSCARVLEEIFRMLESGYSESFFRLLVEEKFLEILFPHLNEYFHTHLEKSLYAYLSAADSINKRREKKQILNRSILTAAVVYPILESKVQEYFVNHNKMPNIGSVMEITHQLIHKLLFEPNAHFPRKLRINAHFILCAQYRLTPLHNKKQRNLKLLKQRDFVDALNFLKIRTLVDHKNFKMYEYWKNLFLNKPESGKRADREGERS